MSPVLRYQLSLLLMHACLWALFFVAFGKGDIAALRILVFTLWAVVSAAALWAVGMVLVDKLPPPEGSAFLNALIRVSFGSLMVTLVGAGYVALPAVGLLALASHSVIRWSRER